MCREEETKEKEKFQKEIKDILSKYKDRVFYILNDKRITYGELLEKASYLAEFLSCGKGPVIVYGHKDIEMVISFIGCILAGRSYVPVDIFTPVDRMEKIVGLSESKLIINNSKIDIDLGIEVVSDIYNIVDVKENKKNNICYNNTCYIIFTSGSTGVPKGVPISYGNLLNFINWISNIDGFDYEEYKVLNQASFSFDLSITDFYYALFNGHTLIGSEKILQDDLSRFLNYVSENKVNVCVMTPTFMRYLLLDRGFGEDNYPMIKSFYFCGEVLDIDLVKKIYNRFPNSKVINAYGPTEATSAISSIVITNDMLDLDRLPVGEINKCNNDIVIVDDEIVIKGKSVFSGYLGNVVGGYYNENGINCYKTGDLGKINGNYLYCLGRKDNQIKLNGYRIELEEIEKVIKDIELVDLCCVVPKRDKLGKVKYLKAYVIGNVTNDEILSFISLKLPSYMIPKFIEIVDDLPVNNNGKLDRRKIESL